MVGVFFGLFRLGFGLVDRASRVIRRRIDSIQLQSFGLRGIDDVVESASRHHHRIAIVDHVLLGAVEDELRFAFFDAEELVDCRMDFIANLLAALQAHHDELAIGPGE